MGFELDIFQDPQLQSEFIEWLVDEQAIDAQSHFEKLWLYYANPKVEATGGSASVYSLSGMAAGAVVW